MRGNGDPGWGGGGDRQTPDENDPARIWMRSKGRDFARQTGQVHPVMSKKQRGGFTTPERIGPGVWENFKARTPRCR